MKSLKKLNLGKTFLMLLLLSVISSSGCDLNNITGNSQFDYLTLDSYEFSDMSEKDIKTVFQAIERLDISSKNGLYHIKQTSGAQVDISEELFKFIKSGFNHTNEINLRSSFIPKIPIVKTSSVEVDPPTDCVAWSLYGMGGVSYSTANQWIVNNYGTRGVPSTAMDSVVQHFYPRATPATSLNGGVQGNALIFYHNANGSGHAVNAKYYDANSGILWYKDNQTGEEGLMNADTLQGVRIYYR